MKKKDRRIFIILIIVISLLVIFIIALFMYFLIFPRTIKNNPNPDILVSNESNNPIQSNDIIHETNATNEILNKSNETNEKLNKPDETNALDLKDYIKPELTQYLIDDIKSKPGLTNHTKDDLDYILVYLRNKYKVKLVPIPNDTGKWKTVNESLSTMQGDCEDWVLMIVSVLNQYERGNRCYVLTGDFNFSLYQQDADLVYYLKEMCGSGLNHNFAFCYIPRDNKKWNNYYWFISDRGGYTASYRQAAILNDEFLVTKRNDFRSKIWGNYVDYYYYDFDNSHDKIQVAFNDKELKTFSNNDEFVDWALGFS